MKKKPIEFTALQIEGNLISPAMLSAIDRRTAGNQTEADYGVPKGLSIRDEIARYFRIGQALFGDFAKLETPSSLSATRFAERLLSQVFGFSDIVQVGSRAEDGRVFAVTLEALAGRVPVVVVPPVDDLDHASESLPTDSRKHSAATAMQDWLNHSDAALWGLASNGEKLRLMRDNQSLTRPTYIEANLRQIFEGEDFATFAVLWLLVHASRFGRRPALASDCALEQWREQGSKQGLVARDRLRDGVEAALVALGTGFLEENPALRERVTSGELLLTSFFSELLRLVYRLIFLMAAEDRDLLHTPSAPTTVRRLYAQGYSLANLRERSVRRSAWDAHHDRWEGLKITFAALDRGEKLLGLPALGGLFARGEVPDLDHVRLSNKALMEAIYRLAWLKDTSSLQPVNWRDMETEELGSVYESLLELTPRLVDEGRAMAFAEGAETKGNQRKTTGSYYTPDSLVQALLDSALDPVLDRIEAETDDPASVLERVTVIDPACGSGHFLLAAARRIASRLARVRTGGVASAADYRHALRDVVRNCIHGVDRNPMAVELTKVALWIETVEPGKPLGFLDANIRCGDALLGVFDLDTLKEGIPDSAYKPLTGDDKETARHFAARNKAEKAGQGSLDFVGGGGRLPAPPPLGKAAESLRALPEDTVEEVERKKQRWVAAERDPRRWTWRIAADFYLSAFLTPKDGGVPINRVQVKIPTTGQMWQALTGHTVYGPLVGHTQEVVGDARAFHWPLEFPDIMERGGFDCVLGNPPWEVMQLEQEEYFAARLPEIAELTGAERKRAVAELEWQRPEMFAAYQREKRRYDADREFVRESGRFPLAARGKVNTYAIFAELALRLTSPKGRMGMILPTGIATDATTAPFFSYLISGAKLVRLADFENREGIFPAVHRTYRFCLLICGSSVDVHEFFFFLSDPRQVEDPERRATLSGAEIEQINPNTRTAPLFRTRRDAQLVQKIHATTSVFVDDSKGVDGNPWGAEFRQGLFDMFYDSALFQTAQQLQQDGYVRSGQDWIKGDGSEDPKPKIVEVRGRKINISNQRYKPLFEAKMFDQYNHRYSDYSSRKDARGHRVLPELRPDQLSDPRREAEPFYWVPESELLSRARPGAYLIGYGEATTATTLRTCVVTVMPFAAVGHKEILIFTGQDIKKEMALVANCNSIVLDYVARTKVSYINFGRYIFKQLPLLPPDFYSEPDLDFILPRVLELTYVSYSMEPFARDLGYVGPPFTWNDERRAWLRAELDAFYANAYGLTRDELRYVLDPADIEGAGYPSETFRVLKNNEVREFGEYRTRRLVLAAWDAQFA